MARGDRKRINRALGIINPWLELFGLSQTYEITLAVDNLEPVDTINSNSAAAMVKMNWPYRTATVVIDRFFSDMAKDQALERCLLHEVMHIVLADLTEPLEDDYKALYKEMEGRFESCIDTITVALMRMSYGDRFDGAFSLHDLYIRKEDGKKQDAKS